MPTNIIHGDVDLLQVDTLPSTAKKVNLEKTNKHSRGVWIELGEHTGNAHTIAPTIGGLLEFYMDDDDLYTVVKEAPAVITHEEHSPLIIPPGVYKKVIETEYDPFQKVIRRVQD